MQLVVVGFEGDVMESGVIDELIAASAAGAIKLVDMLVIDKDENGRVWMSEISDLTLEEEIEYGAVIGGLIGLGAGGPEAAGAAAEAGAEAGALALTQNVVGLTPGEVNDLVHDIPSGTSALIGLVEHTWAVQLLEARLEAGGVMLAQAMIDPQGLVLLGAELGAAMEAAAVVEAAQIVEAEALLEAAEAVVLSEAIQEEAAQRAITALVAAELIEEAAIEEAAGVVAAAWAVEETASEDAK
jgi:uncharacterized membrane protein